MTYKVAALAARRGDFVRGCPRQSGNVAILRAKGRLSSGWPLTLDLQSRRCCTPPQLSQVDAPACGDPLQPSPQLSQAGSPASGAPASGDPLQPSLQPSPQPPQTAAFGSDDANVRRRGPRSLVVDDEPLLTFWSTPGMNTLHTTPDCSSIRKRESHQVIIGANLASKIAKCKLCRV